MLELALLGRPTITLDGEPVADFVSEKARALLFYLAASEGRHKRQSLAGLLWGEMPEERARANLRMALYNLQGLLPGYFDVTRVTAQFDRSQPHGLDLVEFSAVLDEPTPDFERLRAALDLYRGDFLEGLDLEGAPELNDWAGAHRLRFQQLFTLGCNRLADHAAVWGDRKSAIALIRRILAVDPWREESHRRLMRLLAQSGQYTTALAQYQRCYEALMAELGIEPMPETTALYERILAAHQQRQRHNLPSQPAGLIGRQVELGQLENMLLDPGQRLITIAGPGGIGKTRLAIEAASAHVDTFLNGVRFVPLAGLDPENSLVFAMAKAFGYTFPGKDSQLTELLAYLENREHLLVLDNFEHLLDQVDTVQKILAGAPDLKVLVTSRERLKLRWESLLPLTGLGFPPDVGAEDSMSYPAVQLFSYLARRLVPGFSLEGEQGASVTRICRLVEGLPLAIELAATLLPDRSSTDIVRGIEHHLDALASSLRDLPPRHRSLRAAFDHSWEHLDEVQRRAFTGLSIFRGGFTSEAAGQIAGVAPRTLAALTAKSLVRLAAGRRYEVHEVLRQYAIERLEATSEIYQSARDRHSAYYAGMLARADRYSLGVGDRDPASDTNAVTAEPSQVELDNYRAAWRWAVRRKRVQDIRHACGGLTRLFTIAGLYQEAEQSFRLAAEQLKAADGDQEPDARPTLARLRTEQARFLSAQGDQARAIEAAREAVEIALKAGSLELESLALVRWGFALWQQGTNAEARRRLEQAHAMAEEAHLPAAEAESLHILGLIASEQGDFDTAVEALEHAMRLYEAIGDLMGKSGVLDALGRVVGDRGDIIGARARFEEALELARAMGDRHRESSSLGNLGIAYFHLGKYEDSRACTESVLSMHTAMGNRTGEMTAHQMLGDLDQRQDGYAAAGFHYHRALKILEQIGPQHHEAFLLRSLGLCALYQGQYDRARQWIQRSLEVASSSGEHLAGIDNLATLGLLALLLGDSAGSKKFFSEAEALLETDDDRQGQAQLLGYRALLSHHLGRNAAAREAGRQAAAIAEELGLRAIHAEALTFLGHALTGLKDLDEAAVVYERAVAMYSELGARKRRLESQAGQVRVSQARGQAAAAAETAEEVLAVLETEPLEGMVEPFRVHLTCFRALDEVQDSRAAAILQRAHSLLQEQAARIQDERQRAAFLERVPAHRELLEEVAQEMPLETDSPAGAD